jgi:peptidoglycan hydrolase-like protein with peptidoglycan-binding domain
VKCDIEINPAEWVRRKRFECLPPRKGGPVRKFVIATSLSVLLPAIAALPATAQPAKSDQSAQLLRLNMSVVPDLDQSSIRQVQQLLQQKGFDPGPLDGIVGPRTREATRKYQDRFGMKASGEIDNQTLFALGQVEFAGQPGKEPGRQN